MFQRKIADVWLYSLARKIFGSSQGTFLHFSRVNGKRNVKVLTCENHVFELCIEIYIDIYSSSAGLSSTNLTASFQLA